MSPVLIESSTTNKAGSRPTTPDDGGDGAQKATEHKEAEKEKKRRHHHKDKDKEKDRERTGIHKVGTIPLICFEDSANTKMGKKASNGLMHRLLTMINLMAFRGDQFRKRVRFSDQRNGCPHPLDQNVVTKQIAIFIKKNLMNRYNANPENRRRQKLAEKFARELTQFCISQLRALLKCTHLDGVEWGYRVISYRDDQLIPRYFGPKKEKKDLKDGAAQNAKNSKDSKQSKESKESKDSSSGSGSGSGSSSTESVNEVICLERIQMILEQLLETECVEMYTPSMYNVLWDLVLKSTNVYVKAMALKFVAHLEVHWTECAVNSEHNKRPRRMTKEIYSDLHSLWNRLYRMEHRRNRLGNGTAIRFSPVLEALTEFLSRPRWHFGDSLDSPDSKERKDDDDDHDDDETADDGDGATEQKEQDEAKESESTSNISTSSKPSISPYQWRTVSMAEVKSEEMANYKTKREWNTFILGEGMSSGSAYWSFQITSSKRPSMMCFGVMGSIDTHSLTLSLTPCLGDGQCVGSQYGSIGLLGDGSLWRFGKMICAQHSGTRFEAGTKIGILLDLDRDELVFTVNGQNAKTMRASNVHKIECLHQVPLEAAAVNVEFMETMPTVNAANDFKANCNSKGNVHSKYDAVERLKEGVVIGMRSDYDIKRWFAAVSMYSSSDGIRLIESECWRRSRVCADPSTTRIPSAVPNSFEFMAVLQTVMAVVGGDHVDNGSAMKEIPRSVIHQVSKWLVLWTKNESRFWRFDGIGYDVLIRSKLLSTLKETKGIAVGDLVTVSPKDIRCRVWGELNDRILVKQQMSSRTGGIFLISIKEIDRITSIEPKPCRLSMNQTTTTSMETVPQFENDDIEETLCLLSMDDLVAANVHIEAMTESLKKSAFDLTLKDFMTMKMEITLKSLCSFAVLQRLNRRCHFTFSLFGGVLDTAAMSLLFASNRMALRAHFLENTGIGTNAQFAGSHQVVQSLQFSGSLFKQFAVSQRAEMKQKQRGQPMMKGLGPIGHRQINADEQCRRRQCLNVIRRELFGEADASEQKMFCRVDDGDCFIPNEQYIGDLTDYEVFGGWLGLCIHSRVALDIPFPKWLCQRIWDSEGDSPQMMKLNVICDQMKRWIVGTESNVSADEICQIMTDEANETILDRRRWAECQENELKQMVMDWMNITRYSEHHRFDRFIDAIRRGLYAVVPLHIESLTKSATKMTVERLKSNAVYIEPLNAEMEHIAMFWSVLDSLNEPELCQFIAFISGAEEWPSLPLNQPSTLKMNDISIWKHLVELKEDKKNQISACNLSADILYETEAIEFWAKSQMMSSSASLAAPNREYGGNLWLGEVPSITFCDESEAMKGAPDQYLPEVSTCTLTIRLPHYSEHQIMREKLLKAISLCSTISSLAPNAPITADVVMKSKRQSIERHAFLRADRLFANCCIE